MRYNRLNVEVVSDVDVIRNIVTNQGAFTAWLGAGASIEAGVPTARDICEEIRQEIARFDKPANEVEWARQELAWDDPRRRYSTCLLRYAKTPVQRLRYFRRLIEGTQPSFSHHALCLLMSSDLLQGTCLTTNFDKLIEMAFAQQGFSECQSIRSDREAEFWRQEAGKCYVVKLHGDYETYNIQNTRDETIYVAAPVRRIVLDAVKHGGLFLVGSSGYEESIKSLLNELLGTEQEQARIPDMGVYWGVRVAGPRPLQPTLADYEALIAKSLSDGSVNEEVVEVFARSHRDERPCAFFPIWDSSSFFFDLVQASENKAIIGRARRYLDHFMRLRKVFAEGGLSGEAIQNRLARFRPVTRRLPEDLHKRSTVVKPAFMAKSAACSLSIRFLYGDVTSRSLMAHDDFRDSRRAVISPEDTLISASGGAALALVLKAGSHIILNELSKFSKVSQRQIVVTSGGDLPVHYIFHAAATRLDPDGSSHISTTDISASVANALEMAVVQEVGVVFSPLIGSGTEGIEPGLSLEAIVAAARAFGLAHPVQRLSVIIVARDESAVSKGDARAVLAAALGSDWTIEG
jgi:O-acetyl-ADP-ribose deacetylase (regulator of RNase III)/NAD-dependent SIR2 family protein deacetylase